MLVLYADDHRGIYPMAENEPPWEDPENRGWTNKLRVTQNARKKLFKCARDERRDFSYSLNCRELYQRFGGFTPWRQVQFDRSTTGASRLILVEESDTRDLFTEADSDHDNYTQDTEPQDLNRHGGFAVAFVDGHAEKVLSYDFEQVSYYTDRFDAWLETSPY